MRNNKTVPCGTCKRPVPFDIYDRGMFWRVSKDAMCTLPVVDMLGRCSRCQPEDSA